MRAVPSPWPRSPRLTPSLLKPSRPTIPPPPSPRRTTKPRTTTPRTTTPRTTTQNALRVAVVVALAALCGWGVTFGPRLWARGNVRDYIIRATAGPLPEQPAPVWTQSDANMFAVGGEGGNTLRIGRRELAQRSLKSSPFLSTFFFCWEVAKEPVWPAGQFDGLKTCEQMRYVLVYTLNPIGTQTENNDISSDAVEVMLLDLADLRVVAAGNVPLNPAHRGAKLTVGSSAYRAFARAVVDWLRAPPSRSSPK